MLPEGLEEARPGADPSDRFQRTGKHLETPHHHGVPRCLRLDYTLALCVELFRHAFLQTGKIARCVQAEQRSLWVESVACAGCGLGFRAARLERKRRTLLVLKNDACYLLSSATDPMSMIGTITNADVAIL